MIAPRNQRLPGETGNRIASLSDSVYEQIFSQIVSGELPENSRLPSENVLAQRFSVSRPVVREALARLRDDGLVQSRQGSGTYVLRRPKDEVLRFAPLSSISDMQRCFEFRAGLEGEAAYLAALRQTPEKMKEIETAQAKLDKIVDQNAVGVEEDFDFHLAIAAASDNRFYFDTLATLRENVTVGMNVARNLSLMRPRERMRAVQDEHGAITRAIRDGDAARARNLMRAHIEAAKSRVFEGDNPVRPQPDAIRPPEDTSGHPQSA